VSAFDRFADALAAVTGDRPDGKRDVRCPHHGDTTPSMSVSVGAEGRVIVKCHRGCATEDIVADVSLTMRDLFETEPAAPKKSQSTIVATYSYTDESGVELFQCVRKDPKKFLQRHRDHSHPRADRDGWAWNLQGVRRVPFHLPRLIEAAKAGERIYIVEGEKDVLAVEKAGAAATCNPMGAGKWVDAFAGFLDGASEVVVVADNDEPGLRHAAHVAATCIRREIPVRIVKAMTRKDAADHLGAGHGLDDFLPVDDDTVAHAKEKAAAPAPSRKSKKGDGEKGEQGESVAVRLVKLAEKLYELHQTPAGEPFGVPREEGEPRVVRMFRGSSKSLRADLSRRHYDEHGVVANASALADALVTLEGKAQTTEPIDLPVRVHGNDERLIIDLGIPDSDSAVIITADGWKIAPSPVLFRRSKLTRPLPIPERRDSARLAERLGELREHIRMSDVDSPMVLAWLVAAMRHDVSLAVLLLLGEHGTAKTTAAKLLSDLLDPTASDPQTPPRSDRDLIVSVRATWINALDNLSTIDAERSDTLCRIATGATQRTRQLYSDDDVAALTVKRPLILTSIDPGSIRADLADRCVLVELSAIPSDERKTDAEVAAAFAGAHPRLLGALLDLAVAVLAERRTMPRPELPRMADYGMVLAAVDRVLGTNGLETFLDERANVAAELVDGDPLAHAVVGFMNCRDVDSPWKGSATGLLPLLWPFRPGGPGKDGLDRRMTLSDLDGAPRGWPKDGARLTGKLRRIAPNLRAVGIDVATQRTKGERTVTLTPKATQGGERTLWTDPLPGAEHEVAGDASPSLASPEASPRNPRPAHAGDADDAGDASAPISSVRCLRKAGVEGASEPLRTCGSPEDGDEKGDYTEKLCKQASLTSPASPTGPDLPFRGDARGDAMNGDSSEASPLDGSREERERQREQRLRLQELEIRNWFADGEPDVTP